MSRLLLLFLLQLVIVLSQSKYQGMSSRLSSKTRRKGGFSGRRQGRNQDDGSNDINSVSDPLEVFEQSEDDSLEEQDATAQQTASVSSMDSPSKASESDVGVESPESEGHMTRLYPSYDERCGTCNGEEDDPVCGSDGHTYPSMCMLEHYACRKYWDIVMVAEGQCQSPCQGVQLGVFSGFGHSRASNKGSCHHDFFRCLSAARRQGLEMVEVKSCCKERFSQCCAFVESRPWRAGVQRFGP